MQNNHLCYWRRPDPLPISVNVNQTDTISRLLGRFPSFLFIIIIILKSK